MSLDNEWLNFSEDNMEEFEDENNNEKYDKPMNAVIFIFQLKLKYLI